MSNTDFLNSLSPVEKELLEFDFKSAWNIIFMRLRKEITEITKNLSTGIAKLEKNRPLNRYRDVSPYDHCRVCLVDAPDTDYINASLVTVPEAPGRRYILTQGPLPGTSGHFWLMVWEQRVRSIVMLNRLMEKGVAKCFPYFPHGANHADLEEADYPHVGLRVTLEREKDCGFYVQRELRIDNTKSGESRQVQHFHYLTWPDFGVPRSPGAFLNFLWAVRREGSLGADDVATGPIVVHCSAGIGRSGTFALVDSCLDMIERANSMSCVNLREVLQSMRQQRMGLIQTPEQLHFSYQAVVEGGKILLETPAQERAELEFPMSTEDTTPASTPGRKSVKEWISWQAEKVPDDAIDGASSGAETEKFSPIDDSPAPDSQTMTHPNLPISSTELTQNSSNSNPASTPITEISPTPMVAEEVTPEAARREARIQRMARTRVQLERIRERMRQDGLERRRWPWNYMIGGTVGLAVLVFAYLWRIH